MMAYWYPMFLDRPDPDWDTRMKGFRYAAFILLAALAVVRGGQFRIAKITIEEVSGRRTVFRVCLPGRTPDAFAMTESDFMCHIYDWYGFRELDGGFGLARK